MIVFNSLAVLVVSTSLLGSWSPVFAQETDASAELEMELSTDSDGTKGRHVRVIRYVDESCKKAGRKSTLFNKKYLKDSNTFSSIDIEAGNLVYLQMNYSEQRTREERTCSYLVGFVPHAGTSYKAIYDISGQSSKCQVRIVDKVTPQRDIELTVPENSCPFVNSKGIKNGVPTVAYESFN